MRSLHGAILGAAAMLAIGGAASYEEPMGGSPRPGSARNRPSGSKPVVGGGSRERARRMAQMDKQDAAANGGEGTDPFDTSEVE